MLWGIPKTDPRLMAMTEEECQVEVMARMRLMRPDEELDEDWVKQAQRALQNAPERLEDLTPVTAKELGWEVDGDA